MSHDNTNYNQDERYLAQISALIDGELEPDSRLDTLDYLVNTPAAGEFYRQARAVDGLFQGLGRKPVSQPPPRELWQRISDGARQPPSGDDQAASEPTRTVVTPFPGGARTSGARIWMAAAAVVLLAALGLVSARVWQSRPPVIANGSETIDRFTDVTVGGSEGEMTDTRFLVLATELLEADRRYRREMLALMAAIEAEPMTEATTQETSYGEASRSWGDGREPSESDPFRSRPRIERW